MNTNIKIAFISLGCDKNLVDSEIMLGIISEEGYSIIYDEEEADVIIINTCSFILDATEEGVQNILRVASYKNNSNCKALIVAGCMAQRYKDEILKEIPEIDAIVGTGDFDKIAQAIKEVLAGKKSTFITNINNNFDENLNYKRILSTPKYFAYLKISEGCDNKCTYCTIPSLRGAYRSRTIESLVKEAQILSDQGVKELILVAQDTALYGTDLYNENKFHVLLSQLSKIENICWIRILYCYPEHITDETINEISKNDKICKYLDIPIQHCQDNILKMMGRKNSKQALIDLISKLRQNIPNLCLRTTLIVGFPNESADDFESLIQFINQIKFDRLGVFAYSKEENTPAYNFKNQIDDDIKLQRKELILQEQQYISSQINQKFINQILEVLVEGFIENENLYYGRSYRDCYEIDSQVFFASKFCLDLGTIVKVIIKSSLDYDLVGEILN